jgi:hypothetical protein
MAAANPTSIARAMTMMLHIGRRAARIKTIRAATVSAT